ncbi:MAG TPA: type II secretion system F family protein [Nocardioidaceae bacterium]
MTGEPGPAAVAAALLAATALWLAVPGGPVSLSHQRRGRGPARGRPPDDAGDLLERHLLLVALASGAAPVVLVGGPAGFAGGVLVTALVHRTLRRREPAVRRRRREQNLRSLPQVVDLLAVALAAGASPTTALAAVADAVEGPVAGELEVARRGLELGRDPVRVWQEVADLPGLAPLGRSMSRAVETGASVSEALHRLADDLHARAGQAAEARARRVGVRAAAPLGLCLLPGFVLVGVVPLVAATVGSLLQR